MQSYEYSYRQPHRKEGAILQPRFVSLPFHPSVCPISWTETSTLLAEGQGAHEKEGNMDLTVLVRLADVEKRASAALVLFAAHDGMHRT
jgi:hypothetical protein